MKEVLGLVLPIMEDDGRQVVVTSPATEGWMTWFAGAGDDLNPVPPSSGRGEGQKIKLIINTTGSQKIDLEFSEPVELHDGQLFWDPKNWTIDDRWSFSAYMPPSSVIENTASMGNCVLVDLGGYNLIVPAVSGTHDVDLATAVPVPASSNNGYWEVDKNTGNVSISLTPASASWNLLDIPIESFFLKNMPFGNPLGIFDIDTYKAEWVSNRWKMRLSVERNSPISASYDVGGWLMLFRENST